MLNADATVQSSSLLVVGFNADAYLEKQYKNKAVFYPDPEKLKTPEDIPSGIQEVLVRSGLEEKFLVRISNLSVAAKAQFSKTSSLIALRECLLERFPDPPPPVRAPSLVVVPAIVVQPPISPELRMIRDLPSRGNSIAGWVQKRMNYPCKPNEEASRLFLLAKDEKNAADCRLDANLNSIYQAIISLIGRAELSQNKAEHGPVMDPIQAAGEVGALLTELQKVLTTENERHNQLMSTIRSIQARVRVFNSDAAVIENLQKDNICLRKDLRAAQEEAKATQNLLSEIRRKLKID